MLRSLQQPGSHSRTPGGCAEQASRAPAPPTARADGRAALFLQQAAQRVPSVALAQSALPLHLLSQRGGMACWRGVAGQALAQKATAAVAAAGGSWQGQLAWGRLGMSSSLRGLVFFARLLLVGLPLDNVPVNILGRSRAPLATPPLHPAETNVSLAWRRAACRQAQLRENGRQKFASK